LVYGFNDLVFDGGPSNEMPTKYLVCTLVGSDGNVALDRDGNFEKCKSTYGKDGDYEVNGLVFEKTKSNKVEVRFKDAPVEIHCSDGGFGIRKIRPNK